MTGVSVPANSTSSGKIFTFPAGLFNNTPIVFANCNGNSGVIFANVEGATNTLCTVYAHNVTSTTYSTKIEVVAIGL